MDVFLFYHIKGFRVSIVTELSSAKFRQGLSPPCKISGEGLEPLIPPPPHIPRLCPYVYTVHCLPPASLGFLLAR